MSQASRGRIQVMASGEVPCSSSQVHASIAVLPAPMITKPSGGSATRTSSPTGTQRAPSATSKGGGSVAGTRDARTVASTTRRRTATSDS